MYKKLFIPGPTHVRDEILQAQAAPMLGHRSQEYANLQAEVTPKLQQLLYTQQRVYLYASSSSGVMGKAMRVIAQHPLANATSIFTTSGKHAREFKYGVEASMTGVNIGVVAPMSFFSFGGTKGSFFGDLKAHGRESFDFFTDRKVVISRWF